MAKSGRPGSSVADVPEIKPGYEQLWWLLSYIQHLASSTNFRRKTKAAGPELQENSHVDTYMEVYSELHVEDDMDTGHKLDQMETFHAGSPENNSPKSSADTVLVSLMSPIANNSATELWRGSSPLHLSINVDPKIPASIKQSDLSLGKRSYNRKIMDEFSEKSRKSGAWSRDGKPRSGVK